MFVEFNPGPGVTKSGTARQSQGWEDASLVRFRDGAVGPVGGWECRYTTAIAGYGAGAYGVEPYGTDRESVPEPPRGALAWSDLSGSLRIAYGSANRLWVGLPAGTSHGVQPSDLSAGRIDALLNIGYGGGAYGSGNYGTARPSTGQYQDATTWSLDNWGENLLACSSTDGRILEWANDVSVGAAVLANAPVDNAGVMVTDERFVFALAAGGNARKVQWCERENNTVWTPSATNEAGDLELATQGRIMCGARVPGQALILTDRDAHVATYIGPPFVYSFARVGDTCGIISRTALTVADGTAFWMGEAGFFAYRGGAVETLDCAVGDWLFRNLNRNQKSKVFAVDNSRFGEIWWFWPGETGSEISNYVVYSYEEAHWTVGQLSRTAGVDSASRDWPVWFSVDGCGYEHEKGFDHEGQAVYVKSGPFQLGLGDRLMSVTEVISDSLSPNKVSLDFALRNYPNGQEYAAGPYTLDTPTCVRFQARQIAMTVTEIEQGEWRIGPFRFEAREGARR